MRLTHYWPAAALLIVTGCHAQPPAPAPKAVRPVVSRPTLTLNRRFDRDREGDVVIPRDAVVIRAGLPGVFVLSRHGRARFRLIKLGALSPARAQILSGLSGDETLVLGPFNGIYDGTPIHAGR